MSCRNPRKFFQKFELEEVLARTMWVCSRSELICILPLGVAVNSAGKRRLIWDGRHVNANLRKRPFRMETLQREALALFERSLRGGTLVLSSAYQHMEIHEECSTYLGFEWEGVFYCFVALPFGISTALWLLTKVLPSFLPHARCWFARQHWWCMLIVLQEGGEGGGR